MTTSSPTDAFLDVRDLSVTFKTEDGLVRAVQNLSFSVERGKTLAVVGESGSGKSVTSQAIMGLHKGTSAQVTGEIWFDGDELVKLSADQMRAYRGKRISMIFQDPLSSLHPYYRIGDQIIEAYRMHHKVSKRDARARTIEMLARVGIPNPNRRVDDYPHQFSGGMRQRAMIAMALICDPDLIIADEPTTALDVTVQAQILELIKDLQSEFNSAVIIITHDLGVVAETADDVVVMYGGSCVEQGSVRDVFYRPRMPYTWGLLASMPRMDRDRKGRLDPIPGSPPSLINLPNGCVFHPRCAYAGQVADGLCGVTKPGLSSVGAGHSARCHLDNAQKDQIWDLQIRPTL